MNVLPLQSRRRSTAARATTVIGALCLAAVPVVASGSSASAATCSVSVAKYGTDVNAARAALKAVTPTCQAVEFTPGTYVFNDTFRVTTPGVTVLADPGAVIKVAAGVHLTNALVEVAAANVQLQNLTLDGTGGYTDGVFVDQSGVVVSGLTTTGISNRAVSVRSHGSGTTISGCNVTGFGDRGVSTQANSTTIENCTVTGGAGIAISSFGGASNVSVLNNNVSFAGDKGIEIASTNGFTVSGNTVHDSHTLGIHLLRSTNGTISNNVSYHNRNNGIDAHGDTYLTIQGNQSYLNGAPRLPDGMEGNGIIVYCSQHVNVLSNTVWDNAQGQPGNRDGIRISDNGGVGGEMPTSYITVDGNTAYDDQAVHTQGYGIRLGKGKTGDLNNITVTNNNGTGNLLDGIFMKGLVANAVTNIQNNNLS